MTVRINQISLATLALRQPSWFLLTERDAPEEIEAWHIIDGMRYWISMDERFASYELPNQITTDLLENLNRVIPFMWPEAMVKIEYLDDQAEFDDIMDPDRTSVTFQWG
tara:strand:- start:177 stop:503 length:327 start_codon:yes stop_codon:yes gene_type:complete